MEFTGSKIYPFTSENIDETKLIPSYDKQIGEFDKIMEEIGDDDSVEDPEGIAVPWEEKYGDIDEGCQDEGNAK